MISKISQKIFKFLAFNLEFQKIFWINRTIFSHRKSERFWKQSTIAALLNFLTNMFCSMYIICTYDNWTWHILAGQSHYIKVALGDIFMEQKMRFGLVLGRLAVLKQKLGWLWATFEGGNFLFSWTNRK